MQTVTTLASAVPEI